MSREAMKQAYAVPLVEQLESVPANARLVIDDADGKGTTFISVGRMCHEAADALRAALDAPQPEPIKIITYNCVCGRQMNFESEHGVIAPKREWVGLTDEEFSDCLVDGDPCEALAEPEAWAVMREVEAKLKEKNT